MRRVVITLLTVTFTLAAVAAAAQPAVAATALAPPAAVTYVDAGPVTNRNILLSWTMPVDPSIVSVIVRRSTGAAPKTVTSGDPVVTLTGPFTASGTTDDFGTNGIGLAASTRYVYSVFTVNAAGVASAPASAVAKTTANKTPASMSGVVTGPAGQPLAGVTITTGGPEPVFATTAADGSWRVDNLLPGSYFGICFSATDATAGTTPGYAPTCYGGATSLTAVTVTVTAGQTLTGLNVQMPAGGAIAGTITGPAGEPVAGVQVNGRVNPLLTIASTATAADGSYVLKNLPPGPVQLCLDTSSAIGTSSNGYRAECYGGFHNPTPNYGPVTVTAGQTVTGVNPVLQDGYILIP